MARFLLDSVECFAEIVDDIVDMLCADRKSDSIWLDTLICKFCFVKLCVCCWCWVDNQWLNVCYVCKEWEEFQVVDEVLSCLCVALYLECEDRTTAVREILLVKCLLAWIVWYWRVIYLFYLWVLVKEVNYLKCVLNMTFNSQGQCFKTLQEDECVDRWKCCTCITEKDRTDTSYKCCARGCVCKAYAVVAWVWFCELWELAWLLPVKLAAFNDNSADCCAVTADKLCCRMDNDICAVLDRSYEIWSSECAVNEKWDIVCVCDICDSFNINYVWVRVAKSFDIESLCVLLDSLFKVSWVKRIDKCCCDAVINKSVCKQVICAAIDVLCSYDMIACKGYVLNSVCYCCCAWCDCKSCCAALKSCDTSFKNVLSWVCKSAINVACVLKSKSVSGMLWVVENVWWCLINRNGLASVTESAVSWPTWSWSVSNLRFLSFIALILNYLFH